MSDWKDYDSDDDTNIDDWNFDHFLMKYKKLDTGNNDIMRLRLFVDSDDLALECLYRQSAHDHNRKIYEDPCFYDAGFDIFHLQRLFLPIILYFLQHFRIHCVRLIFK